MSNDEMRKMAEDYKEELKSLGNLTDFEIGKLVSYEFLDGTKTVRDQVDRYYLKTKSERPDKAENMQKKLDPLLSRGINTEQDIRQLFFVLNRYWSGIVISHNGKSYSAKDFDEPGIRIINLKDQDNVLTNEPHINLGDKSDLGVKDLETKVNALVTAHKNKAKYIFLLKWQGDKIPRGAEVAGHKIAWTQNGVVTDNTGKIIGTYERLVEFGGESGREQQMIVYISK